MEWLHGCLKLKIDGNEGERLPPRLDDLLGCRAVPAAYANLLEPARAKPRLSPLAAQLCSKVGLSVCPAPHSDMAS